MKQSSAAATSGGEQRQGDSEQAAGRAGAKAGGRLQPRLVEAGEAGGDEGVEVDVEAVGMDREHRAVATEGPGRAVEAEQGLHQAGDDAAGGVEEVEGHGPDQRRQQQRDERDGGDDAAAGEVVAGDEKGQRDADRRGEHDGQ